MPMWKFALGSDLEHANESPSDDLTVASSGYLNVLLLHKFALFEVQSNMHMLLHSWFTDLQNEVFKTNRLNVTVFSPWWLPCRSFAYAVEQTRWRHDASLRPSPAQGAEVPFWPGIASGESIHLLHWASLFYLFFTVWTPKMLSTFDLGFIARCKGDILLFFSVVVALIEDTDSSIYKAVCSLWE